MKTHPAIESAFNAIMQSELFRTNGPAIDLPQALETLARAVHDNETDEFTWNLGEFLECDLGGLIVAAYWSLSEWHAGQSSPEYRALSALGDVFSPGMSSGPEPDSSESEAYDAFDEWFRTRSAKPGLA
jgi:hypothetical protein